MLYFSITNIAADVVSHNFSFLIKAMAGCLLASLSGALIRRIKSLKTTPTGSENSHAVMFCGDKNHLDYFKCNDVRQYHSSHSINSQFVVNLNNGVRQSADHWNIGIYVSYPWFVWMTVYYVSNNTSEFVKVRDTYVQSWHGFTPKLPQEIKV